MNTEVETPEQFIEIQRECIARVRFYTDKANEKLSMNMPYPRVVFSIKGTTAGRAWIGRNLIQFNPTLLRDNVEEFLNRTPGHEVAHLAAHLRFDTSSNIIKPHGHEWQKVMWMLGLPAIRCHNYDTSSVDGRQRREPPPPIKTAEGIVRAVGIGKVTDFD